MGGNPDFPKAARETGAELHAVARGGIGARLVDLARERSYADGAVRIAPSVRDRFPDLTLPFLSPPEGGPDAPYLCVAAARLAVAETGSVLISEPAGPANPDLAETCVCLVRGSDVVPSLDDAIAFLEREAVERTLPGDPALVTGPSRTGDIEQVMAIGVHGPKSLVVLLVEDA